MVDDPNPCVVPVWELAAAPDATPRPASKPEPVPEPAPDPIPLAAGAEVVGAAVDVVVGKRLGVVAAAVVFGVEVAEEAAGGGFAFKPPNKLGVAEGVAAGAAVLLAGAALNRGDADAAAVVDVVGLKPPNGDGADVPVAGVLLNRLLVAAGAVDDGWELGVLLAGVLLWKLKVGLGAELAAGL